MKRIITTLGTFAFLIIACPGLLAQMKPGNKATLDSIEVLKKVGGFVDGYNNPPTAEETRYHNLSLLFFALPYDEVRKFAADKNKFVRTYGFSALTKIYFDSITKADLEIFKDTSSLPVYTPNGIIDAGITVGQYCEMAYTSGIEEKKSAPKKEATITAIQNFIKSNAKFPDSYTPKSFSSSSWDDDGDKDMYIQIEHQYLLKGNDGKDADVKHYFILDQDYKIVLIETKHSNTIKVDLPKIDEWLKLYGRN